MEPSSLWSRILDRSGRSSCLQFHHNKGQLKHQESIKKHQQTSHQTVINYSKLYHFHYFFVYELKFTWPGRDLWNLLKKQRSNLRQASSINSGSSAVFFARSFTDVAVLFTASTAMAQSWTVGNRWNGAWGKFGLGAVGLFVVNNLIIWFFPKNMVRLYRSV